MKRVVLVLVIIVIFGGLIAIGERVVQSTKINANATLKCSYVTHTCENVISQKNSGDYKITITVNGKPGKGIEVDLGVNQGPTGDSYVKTTDNNGVAVFKGIPSGVYYQSANLDNFPKEYGDAYKSWTWATVTIIKGKAEETKIDLHSN